MSDGNQWGGGQGGAFQQQQQQPGYPQQSPQGGVTTFEEIVANFKLLMARGNPTLLIVYLLLAMASMLFSLPNILVQANAFNLITGGVSGLASFGFMGLCSQISGWLGLVVTQSLYAGVTRTSRSLLFEGVQSTPPSVGGVLRRATENLLPLMLGVFLWMICVAVGVLGCFFGVLVTGFLFSMTGYLLANTGADIGTALKRSYTLAVRNVAPLILSMLVAIAGMLVLILMSTAVGFAARVAGPVAAIVAGILIAIVGAVAQFLAMQFLTAAHISMESADTGYPVMR